MSHKPDGAGLNMVVGKIEHNLRRQVAMNSVGQHALANINELRYDTQLALNIRVDVGRGVIARETISPTEGESVGAAHLNKRQLIVCVFV